MINHNNIYAFRFRDLFCPARQVCGIITLALLRFAKAEEMEDPEVPLVLTDGHGFQVSESKLFFEGFFTTSQAEGHVCNTVLLYRQVVDQRLRGSL